MKQIKSIIKLYKHIKKLSKSVNKVVKQKSNEDIEISINPQQPEELCKCGKESGPFEYCSDCYNKKKEEDRITILGPEYWEKVESIGENEDCPHCKKKLSKFPGARKRCEFCCEFIFPKTRPDRIRVIVKDHERKIIDELYGEYMDARNLRDFGFIPQTDKDKLALSTMGSAQFNAKDYTNMKEQLKKSSGHEPFPRDVVWGIFNRKIIESKSHKERSHIYWKMARFVYEEEKNPYRLMQQSKNSDLLSYKNTGLNIKVIISAYTQGCCKECLKQENKIYTIEEAIKNMPIPCKECSNQPNEKGFGWCRCMWQPIFED